LKDRGLLPDALYVKSTLAQMRGDWREARAYNDRALTLSAHQIPFLMARVLLECETGRRDAGDLYLQRLLAAEQRAGPWPLAGVCTAISASQAGCLWNDNRVCDTALRASRVVLERRPATRLAQVMARSSRGLIAVRRSSPEDCEEELEFLEPFKGIVLTPSLIADRLLGSLAHGAGQTTRAIDHFEDALGFCRRSGYRPEMAWTMYAYSKALLDIRRGDHQKRAAILLEESHHLSQELGMQALAAAIAEFRRRFGLRLDRKPAGLTHRELEVLELLSVGKTNKEIGDALSISTNTVAIHVARVLNKTGSSNRTEAASYAARNHLVGTTRA
jgi:DNA-binding CsgD family transcriptional regulator